MKMQGLPSRSFLFAVLTTGMVGAVFAQGKPYPVFTPDNLDLTMKALGPNVAGTSASLAEGDYTTAKERAIRAREQLARTVTFWRDQEREDALTF